MTIDGSKQSNLMLKYSQGSLLVSNFVTNLLILSKTKIATPPFDFDSLFLK